MNTYLSRDAGATWSEILKGPHIYEFGNHGGLIVVAKMAALGSADSVQFSRDEGLSWELVPLMSPMDVHNIRVDPQGVGTAFVIHGTDPQSTPGDGDPDGMVYVLDFDRLLLEGHDQVGLSDVRRGEGLRVVVARAPGGRVPAREKLHHGAPPTRLVLP